MRRIYKLFFQWIAIPSCLFLCCWGISFSAPLPNQGLLALPSLAMASVPPSNKLLAAPLAASAEEDTPKTSPDTQPDNPFREYTPLLLSVMVNHEDTQTTALFLQDRQKEVWASQEDLEKWRFKTGQQISNPFEGKTYYALHGFDGLQYTLNMQHLSIDIDAPAVHFQPNRFELTGNDLTPVPRPEPGGFFNYDLSGQTQSGQNNQLGGIGELGIFNRYGVGTTSFLASQNTTNNQSTPGFVRLNTTWTDDIPEKMRSIRWGDSYTHSSLWGQSVGFGGLQFASNFNTQPNFLKTPLLNTKGEAVLPSTVNLYVNNALVSSQQVNPGPFDITNIPIVNGYGDLTVVSTDLLGRQQTYSLPYYGSTELLKPGLHDYSYEIGFIRNNLGSQSANYGKLLATGTDTVGITNHFTAQWHAELLVDQQTAGVGGNYLWSTRGVWNVAAAVSQSQHNGTGGLATIGFQRNGGIHAINWGSNIQVTTPHFTYLGLQNDQLAPSVQSQTFVGTNLPWGTSLGASYTLQNNRDSQHASLLSVSFNKTFFKAWALGATVLSNLGQTHGNGFFLTLNRSITNQTYLSLNGNSQANHAQGGIQLTRPLPIGTGYGYNLNATTNSGNTQNYQAEFSAQNNTATYTANVASQSNNQGYRGGVKGGVVYLDGHSYLTRQMTNSFAVVQTGIPNIHVYSFNQDIGTTDRNGNILLPNLNPYQNNHITVEPKDFPLNTTIDTTEMDVLPYYRSGKIVKFPVKVTRNALLTVLDQSGKLLPSGVTALINAQSIPFSMGEDGQLFLAGMDEKNKITVHVSEEQTCQFDVTYPKTTNPLPDLGSYVCQ
jgi:outer membrane usher protein